MKVINEYVEQYLKSTTFKTIQRLFAAFDRKEKLKKNHIITKKIFNVQMFDKV